MNLNETALKEEHKIESLVGRALKSDEIQQSLVNEVVWLSKMDPTLFKTIQEGLKARQGDTGLPCITLTNDHGYVELSEGTPEKGVAAWSQHIESEMEPPSLRAEPKMINVPAGMIIERLSPPSPADQPSTL
jgi:secreted trypsin-like serine protease